MFNWRSKKGKEPEELFNTLIEEQIKKCDNEIKRLEKTGSHEWDQKRGKDIKSKLKKLRQRKEHLQALQSEEQDSEIEGLVEIPVPDNMSLYTPRTDESTGDLASRFATLEKEYAALPPGPEKDDMRSQLDKLSSGMSDMNDILADMASLVGASSGLEQIESHIEHTVAPVNRSKAERQYEERLSQLYRDWEQSTASTLMAKALELLEEYTGGGSWMKQIASNHPWLHDTKEVELIRKRAMAHEITTLRDLANALSSLSGVENLSYLAALITVINSKSRQLQDQLGTGKGASSSYDNKKN